MKVINLHSDTQRPTKEMLRANANSELGDDTYGEDPTVKKFESLAAAKLGKAGTLPVISGHMGNLSAIMAHASPGHEVSAVTAVMIGHDRGAVWFQRILVAIFPQATKVRI